MASLIALTEIHTYSPVMSAETVHLKAQLPQTPPPELVHDPLKAKSTVHGSLIREPMPLMGSLNHFKSFDMTPIVGTEFPTANVVDWMKAPNSDGMLQELAVTSRPKTLFSRHCCDLSLLLIISHLPCSLPARSSVLSCPDRSHGRIAKGTLPPSGATHRRRTTFTSIRSTTSMMIWTKTSMSSRAIRPGQPRIFSATQLSDIWVLVAAGTLTLAMNRTLLITRF